MQDEGEGWPGTFLRGLLHRISITTWHGITGCGRSWDSVESALVANCTPAEFKRIGVHQLVVEVGL